MKSDNKLLVVIITVLSMPFSVAWMGYALSVLWMWFVVPLGLAPIGIAHAIGLSIAMSMFISSRNTKKSSGTTEAMVEALVKAAFVPALALLYGAIIHSFM